MFYEDIPHRWRFKQECNLLPSPYRLGYFLRTIGACDTNMKIEILAILFRSDISHPVFEKKVFISIYV